MPGCPGLLRWLCHLGAPGISLPARLLAGAGCGRQGWSFWSEIRGREGGFIQFPCQLWWLISTRTCSNKNRHLHNTGGSPWNHSAGVSKARPGLRSGDAPNPGREAMRKAPCPFWNDGSAPGEGLGGFALRITQWWGSAPTCLCPHHKQRLL